MESDARENSRLVSWYQEMVLIRRFEEAAIALYRDGKVGGSLHPCIGQEAVAVGALASVRGEDFMTVTYRGRGQAIAKGAPLEGLMAEVCGRVSGLCRGKGGPMHITDMQHGILPANAIVGAGIPIAVGAALAAQLEGSNRIAITFFGDGAVNQGAFHEALNLAAVWRLPVVFVCENNGYSEMTPTSVTVCNERLADRAAAYCIPACTVDGNDVEQVARLTGEAVDRARNGGGPTMIEAITYRLMGHMVGDPETYRSKEEVARWSQRDPLRMARERILAAGLADEATLSEVDAMAQQKVDAAVQAALLADEPAVGELFVDVF